MKKLDYIIVGGGITADSAVRGIRSIDKTGSIGLFSKESHPPYNRPPLSKGLWMGKPLDRIWRHTEELDIQFFPNREIISINPNHNELLDTLGNAYGFSKLLLATGSSPRKFPKAQEGLLYFRTLDDYYFLSQNLEPGMSCAIIGGGFIGTELAAVLIKKNIKVSLIFPESGVTERIFPDKIISFLNQLMRKNQIDLYPNHRIQSVECIGHSYVISVYDSENNLKELKFDTVVVGIGVIPETSLASQIGLQIENGIVVSETLRTAHSNIYAAGDVANFPDPNLDLRRRVEHEDNANMMGLHAGKNMAGEINAYTHLPFFYSDIFDVGYEAVGELDRRADIFIDWKEEFVSGTIFYLVDQTVRGILLWNNWGKLDQARLTVINKQRIKPEDLKGSLND